MGLTPMRIVYRDEVIDQRAIAGDLPATGDQVSVNGRWYTVLKRYWHWLGGPMVEIAVSPPSELTQSHKDLEAYRAGREDWARGVVGYLYVGPDGREMLLDPADVTIVRSESQQPRTPEAHGDSEHSQDGGE